MSASARFLLILLPVFLPLAVAWVWHHERRILRSGSPLSDRSLLDATRMGVRFPEKVRVMKVERIPVLNGWLVRMMSLAMPAVSSRTVGLSLGYGIYVRSRFGDDRHLIAHECVHTGQYERLGGVSQFLRAYLSECLEFGYPGSPLEQEAILRTMEIKD